MQLQAEWKKQKMWMMWRKGEEESESDECDRFHHHDREGLERRKNQIADKEMREEKRVERPVRGKRKEEQRS